MRDRTCPPTTADDGRPPTTCCSAFAGQYGHLGIPNAMICIGGNKPKGHRIMRELTKERFVHPGEVAAQPLPAGAEDCARAQCHGTRRPARKAPDRRGVMLNNVTTMASIGRFLKTRDAPRQRRFTVSGDAIARPCNANIIIGTRLRQRHGIRRADRRAATKVVLGGPMMGNARSTWTIRSSARTTGVLVFQQRRHGTARHHPRASAAVAAPELVSHTAVAHRHQEGVHGPGREELDDLMADLCMGCGTIIVRLSGQTAARPDKANLRATSCAPRWQGEGARWSLYDRTTARPLSAAARVRQHHPRRRSY